MLTRRGAAPSVTSWDGLRPRLQGPGDLFGRERLDEVPSLDALDALHADAALQALQHLAHVVLEPLERRDRALAEHRVAALDPYARPADDLALGDARAEDRADLADREQLTHLRAAQHGLTDLGRQHAAEGRLDVVDRVVDDIVAAQVDARGLRLRGGL